MDVNDYLDLRDVADLNRFHLSEIDKEFIPQIIQYDNNPNRLVREPDSKMKLATYELINHLENSNTIAWVGGNEFWDWISKIWTQLPREVKRNIKIGNAFNTRYVNEDQLNLLLITEDIKSNWLMESYGVIDNQIRTDLGSTASLCNYILGSDMYSNNLHTILVELKPRIKEIDDLKLLNKYAELFSHLEDRQSFRDLFLLVDLVSKYNGDSNSSVQAKNKLIVALAKATSAASAEEFFSLQYQNWQGYDADHVDEIIGEAIDNWLENNLFTSSGQDIKSKIVVTGLRFTENHLIFSRVSAFLRSKLNKWEKQYGKYVWDWLNYVNAPVNQIVALLPDSAEKSLLDTQPILDRNAVKILGGVLLEKGWFMLLGMIAVKTLGSRGSFEKMLTIDPKIDQTILEKMADQVPADQFLCDVCAIDSQYLIPIAIEKLKRQPTLKESQDLSNSFWQKIWAESSDQGLALWEGFRNPQAQLFHVFDLIGEGGAVELVLLKEIAKSSLNSLRDYGNRASVWSKIPSECRKQFLVNTLTDCLKEIGHSIGSISELEKPLQDSLQYPEIVTFVIAATDLTIENKLNILETLDSFSEDGAIALINRNTFNKVESDRLGTIVNIRRWKSVAKHIFSLEKSRRDLEQALANCSSQLSFLDKLSLSLFDSKSGHHSKDDCWDALFEKAIVLYPEGPNEIGLWERAGGHRSDLITHGSGKEKWKRAIGFVKNGGSPGSSKIIEKMIEDYPRDEILKKLNYLL
ncbi:hypothetical protein [Sphingobacterium siyangense]|uniref:hypothetical protein n=1 Tax=Sphingobacterium siyangense TaxID=459529 RepID=UPI002FDE9CFE